MASAAWKDFERRYCRGVFHVQRRGQLGPYGWASGSDDDGSAPFAVECKYLTRYQLRDAWIAQARRQGRASGRPWVLGIGLHGQAWTDSLSLLQTLAFAQLLEESGRLGPLPRLLEP